MPHGGEENPRSLERTGNVGGLLGHLHHQHGVAIPVASGQNRGAIVELIPEGHHEVSHGTRQRPEEPWRNPAQVGAVRVTLSARRPIAAKRPAKTYWCTGQRAYQ